MVTIRNAKGELISAPIKIAPSDDETQKIENVEIPKLSSHEWTFLISDLLVNPLQEKMEGCRIHVGIVVGSEAINLYDSNVTLSPQALEGHKK